MEQRLIKIITEVFEIKESEIHPGLSKDDVSNWDSLKHMDLVVSLESEFNIELEIEDIIKLVTIKDIIEVVEKKCN